MSRGPTITIWQCLVGADWRYTTPDVAAMVCNCRPGPNVRLVEVPVPRVLKFRRWRHRKDSGADLRPVRIKNAEKAIARQVERAGLFAPVEAERVPTPEQRLQNFHDDEAARLQVFRNMEARSRRELRRTVAALPHVVRSRVMFELEQYNGPRDSHAARFIMRRALEGT